MHFVGEQVIQNDDFRHADRAVAQEGYLRLRPADATIIDIGKRALLWGKGYAFSPVGFVERRKDPNDPNLAREGFFMAVADWVTRRPGDLTAIGITALLLPVTDGINDDFGPGDHLNPALKLYLLYQDTDIDLIWASDGSRPTRWGFDLSRNLGPSLEIHAEWAHTGKADYPVVADDGSIQRREATATSYLFGLRWISESETTWIAEYYRNGTGYTGEQFSDFVATLDRALDNGQDLDRIADLATERYSGQGIGRRYAYLRASWKEPFDVVYLSSALQVLYNLEDDSASYIGELIYTGITNTELRLRLGVLDGKDDSEFGSKQNATRIEARFRYYF